MPSNLHYALVMTGIGAIMSKTDIADARSDAMMELQSELVRVIEKHEPAMLRAQGERPDVRIVTHDVFNVLANVAIGHLEKRANSAGFKEETGTFAAGAASMFQDACRKIALYTSAFGNGKNQRAKN